jgi:hypothetical protein
VEKSKIRQFVAMPMGEGYTVEEQITGEAVHGGLQIIVYPLKPEFYIPKPRSMVYAVSAGLGGSFQPIYGVNGMSASGTSSALRGVRSPPQETLAVSDMGMAPGGLMEQKIHEDNFGIEKFDQSVSAKCFVHLLNAHQYRAVTGKVPPQKAPTAEDYTAAGLPWFLESNTASNALQGAPALKKLDSVANLANKKGQDPLKSGTAKKVTVAPKVVVISPPGTVRDGEF